MRQKFLDQVENSPLSYGRREGYSAERATGAPPGGVNLCIESPHTPPGTPWSHGQANILAGTCYRIVTLVRRSLAPYQGARRALHGKSMSGVSGEQHVARAPSRKENEIVSDPSIGL
jgi:hypothetical protein